MPTLGIQQTSRTANGTTRRSPSRDVHFGTSQLVEALEPRVLFSGVEYMSGLNGVVDATAVDVAAVTSTGRNVVPDDGLDDTEAINAVLDTIGGNSNKVLYFPDGVYDVSGSLEPVLDDGFVKRTRIQGQSESGTVFKLASGTFTNAAAPEPVWDFGQGAGVAQAFHNLIQDITIDVQSNNDGAVGIEFISSNTGVLRNVTVKAASGTGHTGLDFTATENGPFFVNDVTVDGFDTGVATLDHINSQAFEDLTLQNQGTVGFLNGNNADTNIAKQAVTIHGLTSTGNVPVFDADFDDNPLPETVIIDANLTGTTGASAETAIATDGRSYLRNITTTGFDKAYDQSWNSKLLTSSNGTGLESASYGDGQSDGFATQFATTETGLDLPYNDTPVAAIGNVSTDWIKATNVSGDDTASIQSAIDTSGAKTVVLDVRADGDTTTDEKWTIDGNLYLRGDVERVIVVGTTVEGAGTVYFEDGAADTVVVEQWYQTFNNRVNFVHNSDRTLVIKDAEIRNYNTGDKGTGDVYFENVVGDQIYLEKQSGWFKGLNLELLEKGDELGIGAYFVNNGGSALILGFKTENRADEPITFVHTKNGAQTELLGGVNHYNKGDFPDDEPAYRVTNATFGMATPKQYRANGADANRPRVLVTETQDGTTLEYERAEKQSYYVTRLPIEGIRRITNVEDGDGLKKDLALEAISTANNANVVIGETFADPDLAKWDIVAVDSTYYSIVNVESGRALKATGTASGNNVTQQNLDTSEDTQLWEFILQDDGTYEIKNKASGKLLEAFGTTEDSSAKIFSDNNKPWQRWRLNDGNVPANEVPEAFDDTAQTNAGVAVDIDVAANDTDDDFNEFVTVDTIVTSPSNGSATFIGGVVTYTPNAGFFGTDTFTYRGTDGTATSNLATVTVTVRDISAIVGQKTLTNQEGGGLKLEAISDSNNANVVKGLTFGNPDLAVWDIQPADSVYFKVTNLSSGRLLTATGTENGNNVTQQNDSGTDNQLWEITEVSTNVYELKGKASGKVLEAFGTTEDSSATIFKDNDDNWQRWLFEDAGDNLVAQNDDVAANQSTSVDIDVLANDSGALDTIDSFTQPTNGTVSVNGTTFTYTPSAAFVGTDTFTYTASDAGSGADQAIVTVDVRSTAGIVGKKVLASQQGTGLELEAVSTANNANVVKGATHVDEDHSIWDIQPVEGIYFRLVNEASGRALHATGTNNGANVTQLNISSSDRQLWAIEEVSPGVFELTNKDAGRLLEAFGTAEDTSATLFSDNDNDWQRWSFTDAGLSEALVAGFDFSENAAAPTMVADLSSNAADGTLEGSAKFAANGIAGQALELGDGFDDNVDLGTLDVTGDTGLTIAAYVYLDDYSNNSIGSRIVSKASGNASADHYWMLSIDNDGDIYLRLKANQSGGGTADLETSTTNLGLDLGKWYAIAATWDGTDAKIYVDGQLVKTTAFAGTSVATDNTVPVAIGNQPDVSQSSDSRVHDGRIDGLGIYNKALTTSELASILPAVDATTIAGDTYYATLNQPLSVAADRGVLANDNFTASSGSMTAAVDAGPSNGSVSLSSDGSFTYTPDAGYTGSDSFTYTASDGTGSTTATVTVEVEEDLFASIAFDEASGTTADDVSAENNNGTLTNGAAFVTGFDGNAVELDGGGEVVNLGPADLINTQAVTFAARVNLDRLTGGVSGARVISKSKSNVATDADYELSINEDSKLRFRLHTTDLTGNGTTVHDVLTPALTSQILLNQWIHVAATWDGTDVRFYVDGTLVNTQEAKGRSVVINPANDAGIGNDPTTLNRALDGEIDDVFVYRRALSAAEVSELAGTAISTASIDSVSSEDTGRTATRLLDRSGITEASGAHGTTGSDTMFRTASGNTTATIDVDLGGSYTLETVRLWNYNETGETDQGANEIKIYTSVDANSDGIADGYTLLTTINLGEASGNASYTGEVFDLSGTDAAFVRFEIVSNLGDANHVGLSEIEFTAG